MANGESPSSRTHSVTELARLVGRAGKLRIAGSPMRFDAEVIDVRISFGHVQYKVRPRCGEGEAWVDEGSVTLEDR